VRRVQEEILYRVRTMQVDDEAWRRMMSARLEAIEQHAPQSAAVGAPEGEP